MKTRKLFTYLIMFFTYNILFNGMLYKHFSEDVSVSGESGLFMAMVMLAVGIHYISKWSVKILYEENF